MALSGPDVVLLWPSQPFTWGTIADCWVGGWLNFTPNNTDNTNLPFLRDANLGPYVHRNIGCVLSVRA